MANRKTCVACRDLVRGDRLDALVSPKYLCPGHKRLRKIHQRAYGVQAPRGWRGRHMSGAAGWIVLGLGLALTVALIVLACGLEQGDE